MDGAIGAMSQTAEQVVEVLNAAKLASDGAAKVDHLHSLLELLVRKEPQLLPDFLPEVLELQVDPSPAVRRFLADFIDAAAAANPAPAVLAAGLAALAGMVGGGGGGGAAGAKRALQSAYPLFRAAYTLAALRGAEGSGADTAALEALQGMWAAAQGLKAAVAALAALPGGGDALRQAALRFVEQAALLLTADVVPAVAGVSTAPQPVPQHNAVTGGRAALVREAEALLGQLTALLKQRVGNGVSPAVAAAAVGGAGSIAQQRPQFMGRLLPPLLALANSGALTAAAPQQAGEPSAGGEQQRPAASGSAAAALKAALLAVARSSQPAAKAWHKKVAAALEAMGAADTLSRPDQRPSSADGEPAKRPRLDNQQPPPMARVAPAPQPEAPQPQAVAAAAAAAAPAGAPLPGATPPEQLSKVLAVVQALVAARDATMLAGVVGSLQPGVLADVVLAYLPNLPPQRSWLPPDSAPLEPWVEQLLQLVAAQAPLPVPAPAQQQQQQAEAAALSVAGPGPAQDVQQPAMQQQQQQQQQQQLKPEPGGVVKQAPAPRAPVPPPAAFQLQPVPLTEAQQRALCLDALLRILRTAKTSRQALRTGLAAKLAADADADVAAAVMRELVQGMAGREGSTASGGVCGSFEVALQWLNVLYARECQPAALQPAADGEAAAGEAAHGAEGTAAEQQQKQQGAASGRRLASQSGAAASQYEATLLALLEALSEAGPPPHHPASKAVTRLLLEVPALPQPAICAFLERLAERGPDWCTLALSTARDCLVQRPPSRAPLLQLVLAAAASATADTRSKAVRLAANRLYPDPSMAPAIELAAQQRLDTMVVPPPGQGSPASAAAAPQQDGQAPSEQQPDSKASGDAEAEPPAGQHAAGLGPTDAEAAQLCALYCALCTKKHSLLRHLFEVYGATSDGGRTAIKRNAGGLAKTLGAAAPALLAVVRDPPPGSLPLVLQMLHVLTEAAGPPPPLVDACLQLHQRCKDAQALVPALRGLDRSTALRLLPALLELQPEQLRPALGRLVTSPPTPPAAEGSAAQRQAAVVSPEELLSALHLLDHSRDPALLKRMMQAVTVAISSPQLFPPESLAACISQLLTRVPLPQLFMRTVIQSVAAAPHLRQFVGGILRQLAAKQVWKDGTQWKGWLMCAQQLVPESFPALLSLPADALREAAKSMPGAAKQQLASFAMEGKAGAVPSTTLAVLEQLVKPAKDAASDSVQGA